MKSKSLINLPLSVLTIVNVVFISSAIQAQLPPVIDQNDPDKGDQTSTPNSTLKPTNPPVQTVSSSVRCENLKTIVQQGEKSAVLFEWNTKFFGPNYTPEKRCQIVSRRLDSLVQANNSQFGGIPLTTDLVNNYPVICSPRHGESSCNQTNILFTLKPENRVNAMQIIHGLQDPNNYAGFSINEARRPVVDLGDWAKRSLRHSISNSENHYPQTGSSQGFR